MAFVCRLSKLVTRCCCHASAPSPSASRRCISSAAALHYDYDEEEQWELPFPCLQNTQGHRSGGGPQWVFLASPGVDKGTYASRLAKLLGVPHISMGDLLRNSSQAFSKEYASLIVQGKLLPDEVVCGILLKRMKEGAELGKSGFILDGFPRTTNQAEVLDEVTDIDLAVNLKLREDVFMMKCVESQAASKRGSHFSLSREGLQRSLSSLPPAPSSSNMVSRQGDNMNIARERLRAYTAQSKPVEYHYHKQGKLLDFEVLGEIPQTWPRLLSALRLDDSEAVMRHQLAV